MHRRVIDDMKKESKALKRWMIVLYIAGISFIVSMWLQFDKELLYAYIIISVAAINSERGFRKTQQKISNNIENSLQMIA